MKSHAKEQETIRQYLLGLLPPEEMSQLEERLLANSAFYEELLIVEDELVDEYFADELAKGVLGGDFDRSERAEVQTKVGDAEDDAEQRKGGHIPRQHQTLKGDLHDVRGHAQDSKAEAQQQKESAAGAVRRGNRGACHVWLSPEGI